ncbi:ABC transporter ATP-binding protein [Lapillicoccus sp.]|uniref:ABC transporter ATP-binding protein n=1 Tax=Lapillicoccus sp. TaxID=1909287 RepID=UPI0032658C9D
MALLEVDNLRTTFQTDLGEVVAVDDVSFSVEAGSTIGLVGESGCGKSTVAMSILRLIRDPGRVAGGEIRFNGQDLARLPEVELRKVRGGSIGMVFQEPMSSLNPVLKIGDQIAESLRLHRGISRQQARTRAMELLDLVRIPEASSRLNDYPHQFSGGMLQRVMIAISLACDPKLLIADEPTTALDVTVQAQILELIRDLQGELGMAVLLITHDLGVIAATCDDVNVMYAGKIVERGAWHDLYAHPAHPYTAGLLRAMPGSGRRTTARLGVIPGEVPDPLDWPTGCRFADRCHARFEKCDQQPPLFEVGGQTAACWLHSPHCGGLAAVTPPALPKPIGDVAPVPEAGEALLTLEGVEIHIPVRRGLLRRQVGAIRAVDGVDLTVYRGETLGLVGESGSGKSTLARGALRLQEITAGRIRFGDTDITTLSASKLRPMRPKMQMVFQDPVSSLNPRMRVGDIIGEALTVHGTPDGRSRRDVVGDVLKRVGLRPEYMTRFPHEFSGGQRQRIGIARALVLNPDLIVADEPVSALDVSVQSQVLNLMADLRDEFAMTYLFIAHNLSVVRHVSDRVAVMYLGRIVEVARTEELFDRPAHPYTRALLSAVPDPDPAAKHDVQSLPGDIPSPMNPPSGCRFHTRCPLAKAKGTADGICAEQEPPVVTLADGHTAACHFAGEATTIDP